MITKICPQCNLNLPIQRFPHRYRRLARPPYYKIYKHASSYCQSCKNRKQAIGRNAYLKKDLATYMWMSKNRGTKADNRRNNIKKVFTIKVQDLRNLIAQQSKSGVLCCAVSGLPLDTTKYNHPLSPSIDRIDNSQGYIVGNIRIVSLIFNIARREWDDQIVIESFQQIAKSLKSKTVN